MTDRQEEAGRRRWADIAVIIAGIYALMVAVWSPPFVAPRQAAEVVHSMGAWFLGTALAGALAVAGVVLAQRSRTTARTLTGAAGVVLLLTLLAFRTVDWVAVATLIAPAVVILVATPFLGPMPMPEEEGRSRGD